MWDSWRRQIDGHKGGGGGGTGVLIARVGQDKLERERRAGNANSEHTASRRFVGLLA